MIISATESITMADRASMGSSSFGAGNAGLFRVVTPRLELLNGSQIVNSAFGIGRGGDIEINAGLLSVSGVNGDPFGDILDRASLAPSAIASQSGVGGGNAGSIRISADRLEVLDGGLISTDTFGTGQGGAIEMGVGTGGRSEVVVSGVNAVHRQFLVDQGVDPIAARSTIGTSSLSDVLGLGATGDAGEISIAVDAVSLSDGGILRSVTTGPGAGGQIQVLADEVRLHAGGRIDTASLLPAVGAGRAGDISIISHGDVEITGSDLSATAAHGKGGSIVVGTNSLRLADATLSATVTGGLEDAGSITLNVRSVEADRSSLSSSSMDSAAGDAGSVKVQGAGGAGTLAQQVTWRGIGPEGSLSTTAVHGAGGAIEVAADAIALSDAELSATVSGAGDGGSVRLRGSQIALSGTELTAETLGSGQAGRVSLEADRLRVADDSRVSSRSSAVIDNAGAAGQVVIHGLGGITPAHEVVVRDSVISTTATRADGGRIAVAADGLVLEDASISSTVSGGSGGAGSVTMSVGSLQATRSSLSSASIGAATGDAGAVRVEGLGGPGTSARQVAWTGVGPEGSLSTTAARGAGGAIEVAADAIALTDAELSATVSGAGDGGSVRLRGSQIALSGTEVTAGTRGTGHGGSLRIETESLDLDNASRISTRSTAVGADAGAAGEIVIQGLAGTAPRVTLSAGSAVDTGTVDGDGGNIEMRGASLLMFDDAMIAAESTGSGTAGDITLAFSDGLLLDDARISTDAVESDGGDIRIDSGGMMLIRNGSAITTSVGSGAGTGGNITIDARFLVLESSAILANAFGGPGGNISIFADAFIPSANSLVEAVGKASRIEGRIEIRAPDTDFAQHLTPLPQDLADPADRLGDRCGLRRNLDSTSFTASAGDRLPLGPEAFLLGLGSDSDSVRSVNPYAELGARVDESNSASGREGDAS